MRFKKWLKAELCRMGLHSTKEVAYGYPAGSRVWVSIEQCRRCPCTRRTWDDLFVEPRPAHVPLHVSLINKRNHIGKS